MRHLRIATPLAVAAALLAFAAGASATTITSPTGTAGTPTIHFVSEEGAVFATTHTILHTNARKIEIDCDVTLEGKVESHGANVTAGGAFSVFTFPNCTLGWNVEVNAKGTFSMHWTNAYNATITSTGMTMTATRVVPHMICRYRTSETKIGTITGGNPATVDLEATLPFHEGSPLCSQEQLQWTGRLVTTAALYIDK